MGSMSASDAAPLPRLGEVFFDVRGSTRSMRLSWYADTGIAVFSIWQGGTCTGTFRLPMDDLPRLMDSLQRGVPGGPGAAGGQEPIALGQRPRLAIGAAPEPFTGAMSTLSDEQLKAYAAGYPVASGYATDNGYGNGNGYSNGYGTDNGYAAGAGYGADAGYAAGAGYGADQSAQAGNGAEPTYLSDYRSQHYGSGAQQYAGDAQQYGADQQ